MGEQVFAVPRTVLFRSRPESPDAPQGFIPADRVLDALGVSTRRADEPGSVLFTHIEDHGVFLERDAAEADPAYKQPIPYVAVLWGESILVVRRRSAQGETRLHGKMSIGLGGHIEPVDSTALSGHRGAILRGLEREIAEELALEPGSSLAAPKFVGLINDDSTSVGQVHVGLAFITSAASPTGSPPVRLRETDKMAGGFAPLAASESLWKNLGDFETWSSAMLEGAALLHRGDNQPSRGGIRPTVRTSRAADSHPPHRAGDDAEQRAYDDG
jgi:predicted NUDIX family phosphoesterase